MATVYDELRDVGAAAALEIATAFGLTASFENPGAAGVTVYVLPVEGGLVTSEHDGPTDVSEISLAVPRQTGFPPTAGILTGAVLVYGGVDYGVDRADLGGLPLDLAPVVTLMCKRNVATDEGLD